MALRPKITTTELEALPEAIQAEYKPVSGSTDMHLLDVTPQGGFALENVAPLKSALETERKAAKLSAAALKRYEVDDPNGGDSILIDPDDARIAMETVAKGTGDVDERIRTGIEAERVRLGNAHKAELDTVGKTLAGAESDISRMMLQTAGLSNIDRVKGNTKLILPVWQQAARVAKDADGKRVIEILDAAGEVRPGSGHGGRMTPGEYFDELSNDPDMASAFTGGTSSGSGSERNANPKGRVSGGTISSSDGIAMSASIDDIASGKVTVVN